MRLTRIYVAEALADRKQINLPEQASGHVSRVLRLGQGDALRVFDLLFVLTSNSGSTISTHSTAAKP